MLGGALNGIYSGIPVQTTSTDPRKVVSAIERQMAIWGTPIAPGIIAGIRSHLHACTRRSILDTRQISIPLHVATLLVVLSANPTRGGAPSWISDVTCTTE